MNSQADVILVKQSPILPNHPWALTCFTWIIQLVSELTDSSAAFKNFRELKKKKRNFKFPKFFSTDKLCWIRTFFNVRRSQAVNVLSDFSYNFFVAGGSLVLSWETRASRLGVATCRAWAVPFNLWSSDQVLTTHTRYKLTNLLLVLWKIAITTTIAALHLRLWWLFLQLNVITVELMSSVSGIMSLLLG